MINLAGTYTRGLGFFLTRRSLNGYCGIDLSWYSVSSKFAVYKCKDWRDFVDFQYKNY